MSKLKKVHPKEKTNLHERNRHRERYDLELLKKACPELEQYVIINKYEDESIDFFNPESVKCLNKALLMQYYGLTFWDIPPHALCPPIPSRADYIHYAADLLRAMNFGKVPTGKEVRCLDIGVGANCIYPIIGNFEYGWSFVGTDIESSSLESANTIIAKNKSLKGKVEIRLQPIKENVLAEIIKENDFFDLVVCNPPFHSTETEAEESAARKVKNLKKDDKAKVELNFGGKSHELWYEGGETVFLKKMMEESQVFGKNCLWFTSLVSKQSNLNHLYELLRTNNVMDIQTIPMGQGKKTSRILAWTFHTPNEQKEWAKKRWTKKVKKQVGDLN